MPISLRDAHQAARRLLATPAFTAAAVLTLAVGTGALVAVFALVNSILLQPLPYPESDRLVTVRHVAPGAAIEDAGLSDGIYLHYRAHARAFEDLALYQEAIVNLTAGAEAERLDLTLAMPQLFTLLGVRPVAGRLFDERDGRPDAPVRVLLGEDLWRRRYGGDPGIVGQTVTINERPREVVGVLPADFGFPRQVTEIWMNLNPAPAEARVDGLYYSAVARLRPGIPAASAQAELARLLTSLEGSFPDATAERLARLRLVPRVLSLKDAIVGDTRAALWLLLSGMAFLLFIACANVANLLLVRAEHRGREIAVRAALGASRGAVARLFLAESLLLSVAGATGGLILADWGVALLVAVTSVELPRLHEVRVDGWVVAFSAAVAVVAAISFGMLSALRYLRGDVMATLRGGTRGGTEGPERQRVRTALVMVQLALALTLLVGAGLMARSFWQLTRVDPGFDPEGVVAMEIGLPASKSETHEMIARFYDAVLERVRALPGVVSGAASSTLPLTGETWTSVQAPVVIAGGTRTDEPAPRVALKFITPGYLQAMRTPVIEGSTLALGEHIAEPHPVLISAVLARRLFPGRSAIGQRIQRLSSSGRAMPDLPPYTIIGVVADVRDEALAAGATELVYIPVLGRAVDPHFFMAQLSLVIRSDLPRETLAPAIRDIVHDVDPAIGVTRVRTMDEIVRASTARSSFLMVLLLIAAAASLFLGVVGIYGVLAYSVSRRVREIGIRIALGAQTADIRRLVLGNGGRVIVLGIGAGVLAALALTRFVRAMLFEVSPTDPVTFAGVALLLGLVALIACWLPARMRSPRRSASRSS
jgi:putative ABC transport system permease protein